jgi:capsule polysaccharide modification protein KpsS
MNPWGHLVAAVPLAGAVYLASGSIPAAAAAGAANVLVDMDHVVDYLYMTGGSLRLKSLYRDYRGHRTPKLILALHSWELALLTLVCAWIWAAPGFIWGLATGWIFHLACDQIVNRVGAPFYLLSYRYFRGFDRSRLPCPQGEAQS